MKLSFASYLAQPIINLDQLRSISWAGIPNEIRPSVWRLFLDYEPVNSALRESTLEHKRKDYFDCLDKVYNEPQRAFWTYSQKETIQQINRDLPRTHYPILRQKRIQELFERVLFLWAVRHPASGYVQGMNDLLHPFFFCFMWHHCQQYEDVRELTKITDISFLSDEILREIESDCFWCFSKLLDGLQDLFTKDQPGLYKMLERLQQIIDRVDPQLSKHFQNEEMQYSEFAFRWMNCLLVREFSLPLIFRLWDSYLSSPNKIATTHVYVCAALMTTLSPRFLSLSHVELVLMIQSINPDEWTIDKLNEIIAQAYVYEKMFGHSPSHLKSPSIPELRKES